jgi:putative transposase
MAQEVLGSKLPKRRNMGLMRRQCIPAAHCERSLDFVSDQLANGTRFRAMTVVDLFSREAFVSFPVK